MNKITTAESLIQVLKDESNSLYPDTEIKSPTETITITKEDISLVENKKICHYTFENINFVGITFKHVCFSNIYFDSVAFKDCAFENVSFIKCDLKNCSFFASTLKDVFFSKCQGDTVRTNSKSFLQDIIVMSSIFWNCKIFAALDGNISLRRSLFPRLSFFPEETCNARIYLLQTNLPDLGIVFPYMPKSLPSNMKIYADEYSHTTHLQCPEEGSFIGFKSAKDNTIVKLLITEDALRSSAGSRKCRCSKAKVLSIENIDGTPYKSNSVASNFDSNFIYTVGEIVEVPNFDKNRWLECSTGIHFFITREEAVAYI